MLGRIKERLFPNEPEQDLDPQRVQVATCAILLEVAHADDEFADAERAHIVDTLRREFDLGPAEAHDLIQEAQAERHQATDIWHFTHLINEGFPKADKLRIVEAIWRVVYADRTLDGHEDHLMHKIQRLLNIEHAELIDAKLKVLKEVRGT